MLGSEEKTGRASHPIAEGPLENRFVSRQSAEQRVQEEPASHRKPQTVEPREWPISTFLEGMIEGCQILDFELRYVHLNPSALQQSRRELSELVGRKMSDCYPGVESTELYAVLCRCLRERVDCRFENAFVFPNGAKGVFDLHIVPTQQGLFIFSIDISELRRLSSQMRQSQKIIAIGQLAAGAAHDLANLLTVVTGGSEILLERMLEGDPNRDMAIHVRDAAERCADMISQILAFRRQSNLRSKLTDLNQVIEDARGMLQQLVGEKVKVEVQLAPIAGSVDIHPTQLEQILMNLAVNARDAMPEGGTLSIVTTAEIAGSVEAAHPGAPSAHFARITVTDTGEGMSEEVLARIFEPFFTTKGEGKGAGLGLPTVYNLVQQAGGGVTVASAPGQGAAFSISLPIFE